MPINCNLLSRTEPSTNASEHCKREKSEKCIIRQCMWFLVLFIVKSWKSHYRLCLRLFEPLVWNFLSVLWICVLSIWKFFKSSFQLLAEDVLLYCYIFWHRTIWTPPTALKQLAWIVLVQLLHKIFSIDTGGEIHQWVNYAWGRRKIMNQ